MRYNVAALLKSPYGTARVIEVDEALDLADGDVTLVEPVRGRLRFLRDPAGILVEGHLATRARAACVRCLEPVDLDLELDISEHFRPTVWMVDGPPIQVDPNEEDEPATSIDGHHMLDLRGVLWQDVLVAMPTHTLCREDCAGLCPACGGNRNAEPCDCRPAADPRWAALDTVAARWEGAGHDQTKSNRR